jgi:hypothetical protein
MSSNGGGGGAFDPLSAMALLTLLVASFRSKCSGARRNASDRGAARDASA